MCAEQPFTLNIKKALPNTVDTSGKRWFTFVKVRETAAL
jgi:hypothetical protein